MDNALVMELGLWMWIHHGTRNAACMAYPAVLIYCGDDVFE